MRPNHTETIKRTDGIGHHVDRAPTKSFKADLAGPAVDLYDGELLVLEGLATFTIGSVVSSCLRDGRDPVAGVDRARRLGHELVFIYGNGSMIYSGPRMEPKRHLIVGYGMVVRFEGNLYTIEKAANRNLRLKPYVAATVDA